MPTRRLYGNAAARQTVNRGKCEALRFSIVPSQARKDADVGINRLVEADPRAVFERANTIGKRYVGRGSGFRRQLQRLPITSRLRAIIVTQQANRAIPFPPRVTSFRFPYLAVIAEQPPVE